MFAEERLCLNSGDLEYTEHQHAWEAAGWKRGPGASSLMCPCFISLDLYPRRARTLYLDACRAQQMGYRAETEGLLHWGDNSHPAKGGSHTSFSANCCPTFQKFRRSQKSGFLCENFWFSKLVQILKQCHDQIQPLSGPQAATLYLCLHLGISTLDP